MHWGIYLLIAVASVIVAFLLTPRPEPPKPASLDELGVPTAEAGRPIPVVFGTVVLTSPNVVWYGDLGTSPVKTSTGK